MKNFLIAIVVGSSLITTVAGQQRKSDLDHMGLIGKVKTVKVEEAKLSNKSGKPVEAKRVQIEAQSFNDKGILTKAIRYDTGSPVNYFYSYEGNGNRLELIRAALTDSRIKTEFKYDPSGNRLEEIQTGDQGLVSRIVFAFDARGRITERRIFNKQGLFARRTYTYGADANPLEETEYDARGGLAGKQSYSYELDSTGNWTKRITSTVGTAGGKATAEPAAVTYRTITYY